MSKENICGIWYVELGLARKLVLTELEKVADLMIGIGLVIGE